jgi:hypothetical protein
MSRKRFLGRDDLDRAGKLIRKPSGGERARFLEEESEPRN